MTIKIKMITLSCRVLDICAIHRTTTTQAPKKSIIHILFQYVQNIHQDRSYPGHTSVNLKECNHTENVLLSFPLLHMFPLHTSLSSSLPYTQPTPCLLSPPPAPHSHRFISIPSHLSILFALFRSLPFVHSWVTKHLLRQITTCLVKTIEKLETSCSSGGKIQRYSWCRKKILAVSQKFKQSYSIAQKFHS